MRTLNGYATVRTLKGREVHIADPRGSTTRCGHWLRRQASSLSVDANPTCQRCLEDLRIQGATANRYLLKTSHQGWNHDRWWVYDRVDDRRVSRELPYDEAARLRDYLINPRLWVEDERADQEQARERALRLVEFGVEAG